MYYNGKDLEEYIRNLSQAIIDCTKNDLSNFHITFKKPNNNAPKFIKGDYDLSIHGNKIVLVDNIDDTTVEAKCHPDDDFDIGAGIKEAFKKLNEKREEIRKQKEEEEKKIKVGDWVEVINYLKSYDTYPEWLCDKVDFETVKNYVYGYYAPNGLIGKVVAVGTHDKDKSKKMIGFNSGGNVYIIGIEGVKKVTKP